MFNETFVRRLSVVTTAGMFLVLAMGSTVTNTGSGEGCGRSWPLCHGEFLPRYAVETAIEFSHRLVTGVEGLLIAALSIGLLKVLGRRRDTMILVGLMVGTLVLQSGMGASAVLYPQKSAVLALHFGISMVCFASTYLTTRLLYENIGRGQRDVTILPGGYRWLAWGTLAASCGVAYLGAYMRHSGNELACYTWPSCNGQTFPGFSGPEGISFAHRFAAMLCGFLVAGLALWSYRLQGRHSSLFRVNAAALILIVLQAVSGGVVVNSRLDLASTLTHAGLMALLFVCLADGCRQVLPQTRGISLRRSVAQGRPAVAQ